ncbi:tRNA adenosine deaminase-associated protein [Rhodococcus sp. X156]|uniref:tRNA adenosine deaminase-associated protein n=1 Tax=Rhodococcus sp. X156 TaxID=2499145 RepID=UPI000FDC8EC1|nr:tRNA adenosine deaminase-associated protein [Rhodococcus sp. X156]
MSEQRGSKSKVAQEASDDDLEGTAIAVTREEGTWRCKPLKPAALHSLSEAVTELRELRSAGAVFGLLDVDDEFFLILRPGPQGIRLVLSDATAALDYDIAADALEHLNIDIPDLDPDELDDVDPWAEGELGLLDDLGLPATVLNVIASDTDLYADEQLTMIAERCGFADELAAAVDAYGR